jgi:hypothetical protein
MPLQDKEAARESGLCCKSHRSQEIYGLMRSSQTVSELVHHALQECGSLSLFRTLRWKSRTLRWTNGGNAPNFFARYDGKLFFRKLAWKSQQVRKA